jgi:hypothetical protein
MAEEGNYDRAGNPMRQMRESALIWINCYLVVSKPARFYAAVAPQRDFRTGEEPADVSEELAIGSCLKLRHDRYLRKSVESGEILPR